LGKEIERKFGVTGDGWRAGQGLYYRQGYLSLEPERTVRVRTEGDNEAYLTIKGISQGATRREYEYGIPVEEAKEMLDRLCQKPLIEKKRYKIEHGGLTWEVDEFFGENEGLIIAEVELESEDQPFEKPDWLGPEVTGDRRYFNASLVEHPFSEWEK
jgi:CYTH domain-containing protein